VDSVNGSGSAALLVGVNRNAPYPLDLAPFGAPGCLLRHDIVLALPVTTTGTGPGLGWGTLPVPLPSVPGVLQTQWVSIDPVNPLGIVLSDARELRL
jgi:hypothetical protein